MKKILASAAALTLLAGTAFAQVFTVWDEVKTETVQQKAEKDAPTGFAGVRNRMHFQVDDEKYSVRTRLELRLAEVPDFDKSQVNWKFTDLKANVYLRPLSVLEVAAGTDLDKGFTGHYMIARDQNMDGDTGTWSDKSFAVALRPMEGLMIGVGLPLPIMENFKFDSFDLSKIFGVQAGVSYDLAGVFGIGAKYEGVYLLDATFVSSQLPKDDTANAHTIGGNVSFTGVENLALALGFNSHLLTSNLTAGLDSQYFHNLDFAASYNLGVCLAALDASLGFGDYKVADAKNGEEKNVVPVVIGAYVSAGIPAVEGLNLSLRAAVGINTSNTAAGGTPTLASGGLGNSFGDATDGGVSVLLSPTVGYAINANHSVALGANIKINKADSDADTFVGFNVPVTYTFKF